MIPKIFKKNDKIIYQNTTGQGLYIIVCGTCVVEQEIIGEQGGGGGEQTVGIKERLTTLYPGHFVRLFCTQIFVFVFVLTIKYIYLYTCSISYIYIKLSSLDSFLCLIRLVK